MDETLDERLAAVERTLTDGDHDLTDLAAAGEVTERLDALEAELAALDDRVTELEAASQALRGYVGNVRAVNEDVEQRADLALEKAEMALEEAEPNLGHDEPTGRLHSTKETEPTDAARPLRSTGDQHQPDSELQADATALATEARTRATDGGQAEEQPDTGLLSRLRDFV